MKPTGHNLGAQIVAVIKNESCATHGNELVSRLNQLPAWRMQRICKPALGKLLCGSNITKQGRTRGVLLHHEELVHVDANNTELLRPDLCCRYPRRLW